MAFHGSGVGARGDQSGFSQSNEESSGLVWSGTLGTLLPVGQGFPTLTHCGMSLCRRKRRETYHRIQPHDGLVSPGDVKMDTRPGDSFSNDGHDGLDATSVGLEGSLT